MYDDEELDFTKFRYVLYARKSTTDETRQVRSIQDQIKECLELADRMHLNVVNRHNPLIETQSAKRPNKRPIFKQMLKDIQAGKYDAILAWNPDRLARNMLEGGMLIDMVDTNVIKDLKFYTHHFSKDANGKMLLGMAFVLSKQYSDDLSQKVTRGVRGNFSEGKSPAPKHGYIRDEEGLYRPDGKNYELICDAWKMRQEGQSLEVIAKYMDDREYFRVVKTTGHKVRMTADILSTQVFCNPFYYGVMISEKTGDRVDLREIYDFIPATTEEVYSDVQLLSRNRKTSMQTRRGKGFYPLKAMVQCAFCGHNMVAGPSTGSKGKRYLNYRCDDEVCQAEKRRINTKSGKPKRSIRAKYVFNYIYQILEEGLNFTEKDYDHYYKNLESITSDKRTKLQMQLHSLQASLKAIDRELKDRALALVSNRIKDNVRKINEERIDELEESKENIKQEIEKIQLKITDPQQDKLTLEQFLNLSKNAAAIVRAGNSNVKDAICRIIFLNFSAGVDEMLSYQAKPPFDRLLKNKVFSSGRGPGN